MARLIKLDLSGLEKSPAVGKSLEGPGLTGMHHWTRVLIAEIDGMRFS